MNPFEVTPKAVDSAFKNWKGIYSRPYYKQGTGVKFYTLSLYFLQYYNIF